MTVSSSDFNVLGALLKYLTGAIDRPTLETLMTTFAGWEIGERYHQPELVYEKDRLLEDIAHNLSALIHTAA